MGMTPQEALHEIEHKVFRNTDDFELKISKECYKAIAKALCQQIPTKTTHEASVYRCHTCPRCKNVCDEFTEFAGQRMRVTYNHCRFCGQALDWSDE
jgi:flavoprotein